MKLCLLILITLLCPRALAQQCSCDKNGFLSELVSCEPVIFDNHARLFWNYSCDSSWLTFENTSQRHIIFSMEMVEYTGRLGYSYAAEYRTTFLIRNGVISGCCDPPEFYLFDKSTGKQTLNLDRILFYSEDKSLPFVVSFAGSSYNGRYPVNLNRILIYNVDEKAKYFVSLPPGAIAHSVRDNDLLYPELTFGTPELKGSILTLTYYTGKEKKRAHEKAIDLSKYLDSGVRKNK